MLAFIYKITNSINNKIYIGKTVRCPYIRFTEHLRSKCKSMAISRAIVKYGKDAFALEVIEECPITDVDQREIAVEYKVDKATIKQVLVYNNIDMHKRCYKYSTKDIQNILKDVSVLSRKEIQKKYKISKAYLSQLINGKRRI